MCGKGPYLQKQQRFRMKQRELELQVQLGQRASSCQPLIMKIGKIQGDTRMLLQKRPQKNSQK
jgi:hypothetical protein